MQIFKKIYYSIVSPEFIVSQRKEKTRKAIGYMVFLYVILGLITGTIASVNTSVIIKEVTNFINSENSPRFNIEDGKFEMEPSEEVILKNSIQIIILDPENKHDINDFVGYQNGILLNSTQLILKQNESKPQYTKLSTIGNFKINNETVSKFVNSIKSVILLIVSLVIIIIYIGMAFIRSLIIFIAAKILNRVAKTNIESKELYRMGIYSMTIGTIISFIMLYVPIVPYIPILKTLILYVPSMVILRKAMIILLEKKQEQDTEGMKG